MGGTPGRYSGRCSAVLGACWRGSGMARVVRRVRHGRLVTGRAVRAPGVRVCRRSAVTPGAAGVCWLASLLCGLSRTPGLLCSACFLSAGTVPEQFYPVSALSLPHLCSVYPVSTPSLPRLCPVSALSLPCLCPVSAPSLRRLCPVSALSPALSAPWLC